MSVLPFCVHKVDHVLFVPMIDGKNLRSIPLARVL
jgi:hypothetical protein